MIARIGGRPSFLGASDAIGLPDSVLITDSVDRFTGRRSAGRVSATCCSPRLIEPLWEAGGWRDR